MKTKGIEIYPHTAKQLEDMVNIYKKQWGVDKAYIMVWREDVLDLDPHFVLFKTEEDAKNYEPDVMFYPFVQIGEC